MELKSEIIRYIFCEKMESRRNVYSKNKKLKFHDYTFPYNTV